MSSSLHKLGTTTIIITTSITMLLLYLCQATTNNKLHPVILVPGAGGNQLEARLTRDYKPTSLLCNRLYPIKKHDGGWFRLWFDPSVLIAPFTECFAQRMMLYYDKGVDDYRNAPGIETRVPRFGSTSSLLYLDPSLKQVTAYMSKLVESLKQIGYVENETLLGAPYDFRYGLAPEGHQSKVGTKFLQDLKKLIETASKRSGGKPVIILSHSLGGLFALQLLNRNPLSWRKRFVKQLVALSAPWGGTVEQMLTFASGNTLGVPLVDPLLVRGEQRSSESNLWLLPNPEIFDRKNIVVTPTSNYSVLETALFLNDIGFPEGVHPYESRILPMMKQLSPPEIPVVCIIGSGVKTQEVLFYNGVGFDEQPEVVYGDGDGTVNMVSLLALESLWASKKTQLLKVVKLSGVSHAEILKNDKALNVILGEIKLANSLLFSSV